MNCSVTALALSAVLLSLTGCGGGGEPAPIDLPPDAVTEDELRMPAFSGTYVATASADSYLFGSELTIAQRGPKLVLKLDMTEYTLVKVRPGAYVFESPWTSADCDDPGCFDIVRVTGVVYLKEVEGKKVPAAKITAILDYIAPEEEDDLEGEHPRVLRFVKKR